MTSHAAPTRLMFVSHPATPQLMGGIFPMDEALDARAFAELEQVRWRPKAGQKVWASPELRTVQTAKALGLEAEVATELRECEFGVWRGRSLQDVANDDPAGLELWLDDPGATPHHGESFRELIERVGAWLDGRRQAGSCVVVTHASVVRAAVVHALSAPPESFRRIEVAPITLTAIRQNGTQWHVSSVGLPLKGSDCSNWSLPSALSSWKPRISKSLV